MASSGRDSNTVVNTLEGYRRQSWMKNAPGSALLSDLNIAGTHDSGAHVINFNEESAYIQTQTQSVADQLIDGIRFLDVRGRLVRNELHIYHDIYDLHLSFESVQNMCVKFLQEHPSECVVMLVKDESSHEHNTATYQQVFNLYVKKAPAGMWYLDPAIPDLESVRGKMVLLRRFDAETPEGINCTAWENDATFSITDAGATLRVQDNYKVNTLYDISSKWDKVRDLLDAAANRRDTNNRTTWYLNYTAGAGIGATPQQVAEGSPDFEGVNQHLNQYLSEHTRARYGTIPLDYPRTPAALIPRIISMNELRNCWSQPINVTRLNHAASKLPPALAALGNRLFMAFLDSDQDKTDLWICHRVTSGAWSKCVNVTGKNHASSKDMPALAAFNGRIYMAFTDDKRELNNLFVCHSPDGENWSECTKITEQNGAASQVAPALASFNGRLYMAWVKSDSRMNEIGLCSSSDGVHWSLVTNITDQNQAATSQTPSLAAFRGKLYLAFRDSDARKTDIWICSSSDGAVWPAPCTNLKDRNGAATRTKPTICSAENSLCMAFVDDVADHPSISVCTTSDGSHWSERANVTAQNPGTLARWATALAFLGDEMCMAYLESPPNPMHDPGAQIHDLLFSSIVPLA